MAEPASGSEPEAASSRRRTFGPTVLLGLAAATLAAVAGTRDWVRASGGGTPRPAEALVGVAAGQMPLAAALSLVVLACWGVVLVTRGRFRRAVAVLAALAALGLLVTTAVGFFTLEPQLRDALARLGPLDGVQVSFTGWYLAGLVAALASVAATLAAVRWVPGWPEMGSRYDAPARGADEAPATDLDVWKALDEGRDPTA